MCDCVLLMTLYIMEILKAFLMRLLQKSDQQIIKYKINYLKAHPLKGESLNWINLDFFVNSFGSLMNSYDVI